jgi:predicted esterase
MARWSTRARRVRAKVCSWLVPLAVVCVSEGARAAEELPGEGGELGVVLYPATTPGPRRVTVVLHGMCGEPRNTCAHFAARVTKDEHLVCPRASQRCEGGGASWPQRAFAEPIQRAVVRAEVALGERVERAGGRTLIGYSLGAYRAAELLQHGAGDYRRALLIGARLSLDPRRLRASGLTRLVLAAGAWDMTHAPLSREATRLARAGFSVRFLGLGPVGHAFAPSFGGYLDEARAWLADAPS